jgi:sec-independent protein translocase protein TatC
MKLRPIGQEDRLSIIDHLDELRSRVIICVAALLVIFCLCFWQNHPLLNLLNHALPSAAKSGLGHQPRLDAELADNLKTASADLDQLARYLKQSTAVAPAAAGATHGAADALRRVAKEYPESASAQEKPIVVGVGEGFTVTMLISAYFAVLITLPLLLYQTYAFVLPALSRA